MTQKEGWIKRGDDVKAFPFVVVFADRAIFPACEYFHCEKDAREVSRGIQNIQERRLNGKRQESRLIFGSHPATLRAEGE